MNCPPLVQPLDAPKAVGVDDTCIVVQMLTVLLALNAALAVCVFFVLTLKDMALWSRTVAFLLPL